MWNIRTGQEEEMPNKVGAFLEELIQLCVKYDLSISHEDGHGAFEIEEYSEYNIEWLQDAHLNLNKENL